MGKVGAVRLATSNPNDDMDLSSFDAAVTDRFACKAFQRSDDATVNDRSKPSTSKISVVRTAAQCLELSRLSPSSFNTQVSSLPMFPYERTNIRCQPNLVTFRLCS